MKSIRLHNCARVSVQVKQETMEMYLHVGGSKELGITKLQYMFQADKNDRVKPTGKRGINLERLFPLKYIDKGGTLSDILFFLKSTIYDFSM